MAADPAAPEAASGPPEAQALVIAPLPGLGEIRAGTDLAHAILTAIDAAGPECSLQDGDVLAVSSKIVSKARGLVIAPETKEAAVTAASVRTVARRRHGRVVTSVVETVAGPVMAAAGIDASNAPDGLLLLPKDPDAEAHELCAELRAGTGAVIGVLLTDTSSRIWRRGVTDIALGASGVHVLEDLRGRPDAQGRTLGVTVRDVADELAAAADLVKAKATGVPVAIIRGLTDAVLPALSGPGDTGARVLCRGGASDWFPRPSLESVWQAMGLSPEQEPIAAMDPEDDAERIRRAVQVACRGRGAEDGRTLGSGAAAEIIENPEASESPVPVIEVTPRSSQPGPGDWAEAGMLLERIRTALGAEAIARPLPRLELRLGTAPASALAEGDA